MALVNRAVRARSHPRPVRTRAVLVGVITLVAAAVAACGGGSPPVAGVPPAP